MIKKSILQLFLLFISVSALHLSTYAQSDRIEGLWFNDIKDAKIQIYKARDGKFYGKIIWLKEPMKQGKPKLDDKNPKKDMQNQTIVGLLILKGFQKDGDNYYTDGTIYDPTNGKTYDCKMTYKGKTLSIRGYVGISLFGRTTIWERAS